MAKKSTEIKLVIGQKDGKCVQKVLESGQVKLFSGLKIGDTVKGETLNLTGWEFKITGGSDNCGFPMRFDVDGPGRKRILIVPGSIGVKKKSKSKKAKVRKTVRGNTFGANTAQINVKVITEGKTPLVAPEAPAEKPKEEAKPKEKAPEKEKKKEPKPEEKKEAPKEKAKPEEKKEEKKEAPKEEPKSPKEEKKEEPKPKEKPKEEAPKGEPKAEKKKE